MKDLKITGEDHEDIKYLFKNKHRSLDQYGLTNVVRVLIEKHNQLIEELERK